MRILLVEDELEINETLTQRLRLSGYEVDSCFYGNEALELAFIEEYDLVILDLNLPDKDGLEVLKEIRAKDQVTNILILSARGQVEDKVQGLDLGANDYLVKPFHYQEFIARIRSLMRRKVIQHNLILEYKEISLNTETRETFVKGRRIDLTRKELNILEYLLLHRGRPVSQEEFIQHVWDSSVDSFSNSIRVHMSSLRKKLKAELGYNPIANRIGEGYILRGYDE